MGIIVERARQKLRGGNVVSIEPTLRERRFKKEHHWQTTRSMLHLVRSDFTPGARKVRILRGHRKPFQPFHVTPIIQLAYHGCSGGVVFERRTLK